MPASNLSGKKIALGVCGGISAYKVVEVARQLTKAGADVHVVMTPSASNFVGQITFSTLTGNPVRSELFPERAPSEIPHTDLGRTADLIVIAPATAKVIAKFAQGISDDLMSALLLSAQGPILMAPAMHTEMWEYEATQGNVEVLRGRGVTFVGPDSGALAGPDIGIGRLADPADIIDAIDQELSRRSSLEGVTLLITAGGTREPIDSVRFIGNRSSGRMGFELAREAIRRGAKVILISGPTHLVSPSAADVIHVGTAAQMSSAVWERVDSARAVIMCAAVADWRPVSSAQHKLKKTEGPPVIELEATEDILSRMGQLRHQGDLPNCEVLVGFCAETSELEHHARLKLESKGLDLIVGNLVGVEDSGFDVDTNRAIILTPEGTLPVPDLQSKRQLARILLDAVAERL